MSKKLYYAGVECKPLKWLHWGRPEEVGVKCYVNYSEEKGNREKVKKILEIKIFEKEKPTITELRIMDLLKYSVLEDVEEI